MATKKTAKKKAPATRGGAKAKAASRLKPKATVNVATPSTRVISKAKVAKKTPRRSVDDHTMMTQTLVFIFAMLCIIFAAVAYYSYT